MDFTRFDVSSFSDFTTFLDSMTGEWTFRGQSQGLPLKTSLERTLDAWSINLQRGPEVERQLIRDFRRRYRGPDRDRVSEDTLYCLSLMQHHGAPTRLLDWSYSPFVASKFAIQEGFAHTEPVVWCVNGAWLYTAAKSIIPEVERRNVDASRTDATFISIFLDPKDQRKVVFSENALHLNERLVIQQGAFLCPGNARITFEDNLKAMPGWELPSHIVKLRLRMAPTEFVEFAKTLRWMNVSSASLFPGLDGMARSLGEHTFHYWGLAEREVGEALN